MDPVKVNDKYFVPYLDAEIIQERIDALAEQMNHDYKEGSDIVPHIHLYIPDDGTGGVIKFYMNYTWVNIDSTGSVAETTVSGTITRTANQGIGNNAILSFGTISGTGKTFTISGVVKDQRLKGIMPRTFDNIFQ
jgi:hypothetical protein